MNVLQEWFRQFNYRLYIFDFDQTLLKLHSWQDRGCNQPLSKSEFKRRVSHPEKDFFELNFIHAFFKACRENGCGIGIVSDQYSENIQHYLEAVNLNQYFSDVNLKGRTQRYNVLTDNYELLSKRERIEQICQKIGIGFDQVLFFDDDLENIYQLYDDRWLGSGIWLAEGPFGQYVLKRRLQNQIPYLCQSSPSHHVMHRVSPNLQLKI